MILYVAVYMLVVGVVILGLPLVSEKLHDALYGRGKLENMKTEYRKYHENGKSETHPYPDGVSRDETIQQGTDSPSPGRFSEKTNASLGEKPIICIVIDDFGYSIEEYVVNSLRDLPITVSIIPFLEHSKQIYEMAKENGKEVILHIPMEAYDNRENEKNHIKTSMTRDEIISFLDRAFSEIDAAGINNHMGSKATESEEVMDAVFSFLVERGKFFLDSYTTPNTVGPEKAEEYNTIALKRDIFLDNVSSKYYIQDQLEKMENIAIEKGYCIAIGHARKRTIAMLSEWYRKNKDNFLFLKLGELYRILGKKHVFYKPEGKAYMSIDR